MLKSFKLLFPLINLHTIHHNGKGILDFFCKHIKKENWTSHWQKYSEPLPSCSTFCSDYSIESSWVLRNKLCNLDLGIFCHSSLQILSVSVRLDGDCRWRTIFRSCQRCSIGFKSWLWLGHSRIFTESFEAFTKSVPQRSPVSELCRQFLRPHGLVFALIKIVSCENLYRQCMPLQIMSNQQVDCSQDGETSQILSREIGSSWATFQVSNQRHWILMPVWYFSFSFWIHVQKCMKFCFSFSLWCIECRLTKGKWI